MKINLSKKVLLGVGVVICSIGNLYGSAPNSSEIKAIQAEIIRHGASWKTKDSWVLHLKDSEIGNLFGLQKPPQGELNYESIRSLQSSEGTTLDWRNQEGVNWLGPVMNQGNCGSCVAFSTIATLEAQSSITAGIPGLRPTYSPQYLFSCGGARCEYGWTPDGAADFLQSKGVTDEACMPYTSGSTGVDALCTDQCRDADSRLIRILKFSTPTSYGGSIDAVKDALKRGPLMTTLMVYADFLVYGEGVYRHVYGRALGGHAVSIVGYSDKQRAWLIRNSWGTEWGDQGFAWVSWDDRSGVGANTWALEVSVPGSVSVSSPADREYISGLYDLTGQHQLGKGVQSLQFRVTDTKGTDVARFPCDSSIEGRCNTSLDTTTLKEGRYQIRLENSSNSSERSQVREFYVINSEPKMKLSFRAAPGTNLNNPIQGRPEFLVDASFSPIPIQRIQFRAVDQSGKIVSVKENPFVLEKMKMGWRTDGVPPGRYKILFHGETWYRGKLYQADSNSQYVTVATGS
jgi:hypothetical protein